MQWKHRILWSARLRAHCTNTTMLSQHKSWLTPIITTAPYSEEQVMCLFMANGTHPCRKTCTQQFKRCSAACFWPTTSCSQLHHCLVWKDAPRHTVCNCIQTQRKIVTDNTRCTSGARARSLRVQRKLKLTLHNRKIKYLDQTMTLQPQQCANGVGGWLYSFDLLWVSLNCWFSFLFRMQARTSPSNVSEIQRADASLE